MIDDPGRAMRRQEYRIAMPYSALLPPPAAPVEAAEASEAEAGATSETAEIAAEIDGGKSERAAAGQPWDAAGEEPPDRALTDRVAWLSGLPAAAGCPMGVKEMLEELGVACEVAPLGADGCHAVRGAVEGAAEGGLVAPERLSVRSHGGCVHLHFASERDAARCVAHLDGLSWRWADDQHQRLSSEIVIRDCHQRSSSEMVISCRYVTMHRYSCWHRSLTIRTLTSSPACPSQRLHARRSDWHGGEGQALGAPSHSHRAALSHRS